MVKDRNSWDRHGAFSQNPAENQKISDLIRKHEMANQRIEFLIHQIEDFKKRTEEAEQRKEGASQRIEDLKTRYGTN